MSGFLCASLAHPAHAQDARLLDEFESLAPWTADASEGVKVAIDQAPGVEGRALKIDFDFGSVSGYAFAGRTLPLTFPENYEIAFWIKADAPINTFEMKLIDASGQNVWWENKPDYVFPNAWTRVRIKKRQIDFAWGPTTDKTLRTTDRLEFVVTRGKEGGKGTVLIDGLTFRELPPEDAAPPTPTAEATGTIRGAATAAAFDGDPSTAWRARGGTQTFTVDLGRMREFGGLELDWAEGAHASDYVVSLSEDGREWTPVRTVRGGDGGRDPLLLTESEARYVRLDLNAGPGREYGLRELRVKDLAWGETPTTFVKALAEDAPRGLYPRGFVEQSYWTLIGADGASDSALIGEDGAIEIGKGGFSIEPFVREGDRLVTWADVTVSQSLQDGYLPIPTVTWTAPAWTLKTTAFVSGGAARSGVYARYDLTNTGPEPQTLDLLLAARPFQVNGPDQFLNTPGGVSRIERLAFAENAFAVNGRPRIWPLAKPDAVAVGGFDAGLLPPLHGEGAPKGRVGLSDTSPPGPASPAVPPQEGRERSVVDETGLASGTITYRLTLAPGQSRTVGWWAPLTGPAGAPDRYDVQLNLELDAYQQSVADQWRARLDRVDIRVPDAGRPVVDTLRSSLAHILMSREGPILKPGTRSYDRSWIRDGAMIAEGLIRLGSADVAADYLRWYAPYQFESGKIPCCVDRRGADPVPENDSHGEFVFLAAEVWRAGGDEALLREVWPRVDRAIRYMDELRASETDKNASPERRHLYGLLPPSISHEGYSAKPAYSHWDNFWGLLGYKEAVGLAEAVGDRAAAERIARERDAFRRDLYASIAAMPRVHGIDFIPGAADLGDFDATSTTIALAPGGELAHLPQAQLEATFERYWREFVARREGPDTYGYTPYEIRNVGAFVRLGWRDRALELMRFFLDDRRPAAWNQWAEALRANPRESGFIGDMPHAWISSDYVRAALDLFAWRRERDEALVLAAGVPPEWLDGEGVGVAGLRTPYGELTYELRRAGNELVLDVAGGVPPGGFVLPWPLPGSPGRTTVDGRRAAWENGEIRLTRPGRLRAAVLDAAPSPARKDR
jgi:hypothetical protein